MTNKQLELLNNVIEAAVQHGGDYGGAYHCYPDALAEAMDALVASLGDDYYWKWDNPKYQHIPSVYRK
jgi:hypothetical protein